MELYGEVLHVVLDRFLGGIAVVESGVGRFRKKLFESRPDLIKTNSSEEER